MSKITKKILRLQRNLRKSAEKVGKKGFLLARQNWQRSGTGIHHVIKENPCDPMNVIFTLTYSHQGPQKPMYKGLEAREGE